MLPPRARLLRAFGYSAVGWAVLALLRTSLRVVVIPRPPAQAAAVLGQVLLASLPWLLAGPAVVILAGRLGWQRGWRARTVAVHAAAALMLSLLEAGWSWLILPVAGYPMTLPAPVFYLVRLDQSLFLYLCLLGIGLALRHRRRRDEAAARGARLESRLLHARLHILELQLHPHFLFNTLNAVSELVHRDAALARAVLADLRELLGRSLDPRAGQEIALRDELALLEPYARIQRTRFAGSLDVVVDVDPATLDAAVPRLVLQPLVENAIRHGTSRRAG
ncbi:MAG: histidine kinase, partial [Chloroflexota bacterium]|nr:histidine kinase [Chloroflexota bacterium]